MIGYKVTIMSTTDLDPAQRGADDSQHSAWFDKETALYVANKPSSLRIVERFGLHNEYARVVFFPPDGKPMYYNQQSGRVGFVFPFTDRKVTEDDLNKFQTAFETRADLGDIRDADGSLSGMGRFISMAYYGAASIPSIPGAVDDCYILRTQLSQVPEGIVAPAARPYMK